MFVIDFGTQCTGKGYKHLQDAGPTRPTGQSSLQVWQATSGWIPSLAEAFVSYLLPKAKENSLHNRRVKALRNSQIGKQKNKLTTQMLCLFVIGHSIRPESLNLYVFS